MKLKGISFGERTIVTVDKGEKRSGQISTHHDATGCLR